MAQRRGNGASMYAVHEGKSIDTSMGFTPTALKAIFLPDRPQAMIDWPR